MPTRLVRVCLGPEGMRDNGLQKYKYMWHYFGTTTTKGRYKRAKLEEKKLPKGLGLVAAVILRDDASVEWFLVKFFVLFAFVANFMQKI